VAFSPDGTRLLSSSSIETKLWDAGTGQLIRTFKDEAPLTFSPDGTRVLSGSPEKKLKLRDGKSGQPVRTFNGHDDYVSAVTFSPDGSRVLSVGSNSVKLWDPRTGELIRAIEAHVAGFAVKFSSDGTRLLSGGQQTLKLWDAATDQLIRIFEEHPGTSSAHS
jgi:WD40 repeat protein